MIHKTAIVDRKAKVSSTVRIGAFSVIGPDVEIGDNTIIHSQVNISGHTKIGKGNQIYPFAAIGNNPQDLKYKGEKTKLVIGNNNKIREYVTIHPGTGQMAMIGGMTGVLHDVIPYGLSVGNRNYLQGLNLIGLRRAKFENKDILELSEAYKHIFATKNLNENLNKLNGQFTENPLVKNVVNFINKDKKRSICTPFLKE